MVKLTKELEGRKMKSVEGLNEEGKRELLRFLAENVNNRALDYLISAWVGDLSWNNAPDLLRLEVDSFHSKTGNPQVIDFTQEFLDIVEIEDED